MSRTVGVKAIHWIAGQPPGEPPFGCRARLRHRQHLQDCVVEQLGAERWEIRFRRPQRAVTPGQSAVLYLGDECLGGGVIEQAG
jgi:tRNA-specific 2-thiouridylase